MAESFDHYVRISDCGESIMSDTLVKSNSMILAIRWIARIWSVVSLGLLLLFFIGEGFEAVQITLQEWVLLLFFPLGIVLGMAIAWRWEGLGGGITLGSLFAFYIASYLLSGRLPGGPYFALFAAPGLLFLICWLRERRM